MLPTLEKMTRDLRVATETAERTSARTGGGLFDFLKRGGGGER